MANSFHIALSRVGLLIEVQASGMWKASLTGWTSSMRNHARLPHLPCGVGALVFLALGPLPV
eukprot:1152229-Pelagomonas_calceolata.AAC.6